MSQGSFFSPPLIESQALALKPGGEGKSQGNSCAGEQPGQIGGRWGQGPWGTVPRKKPALMDLPVLREALEFCCRVWEEAGRTAASQMRQVFKWGKDSLEGKKHKKL